MYLYVLKPDQLKKVPESLLLMFGQERHVMDMLLTPERKLARAKTATVIHDIETNGFYLQMPPTETELAIQTINPMPI